MGYPPGSSGSTQRNEAGVGKKKEKHKKERSQRGGAQSEDVTDRSTALDEATKGGGALRSNPFHRCP